MDPACPDCKYPFNVSLQTDRYYILSELQSDLWANEGGLWQGHFCQGSLIAPNWALTTVNCVDVSQNIFTDSTYIYPEDIWVEIGLHHIDSNFMPTTDSITVENIYIHPSYNLNDPGLYNYALLELSESSNYEPIQLISDLTYEEVGDSVTVMGWGAHSWANEWIMDHFLRENSSAIGECNQLWSLHETILCLTEWDLDNYEDWDLGDALDPGFPGGACDGDWGASLVILNDNNEYELLGNFVSGCVMSLYNQNRFSKISTVSDWIYSYTGGPCFGGATLDVSIVFDEYPEDTSWELWYKGQDPDGGYLYLVESGDASDDRVCILDEGVYEFVIHDESGNGLCCTSYPFGSYEVTLDTGEWNSPDEHVVAQGGVFGLSEGTLFAWPDSDHDLIINSEDSNPDNQFLCGDQDSDGCDDCSSGVFNLDYDCTVFGDVNQDYSLDVLDIVIIVNSIIGTAELSDDQFDFADSNDDGAVDVLDVIILMNIIISS